MYPFIHLLAFKVVVYSVCQHAVLPSHIDAHLKDKVRHNVVKEQRERVIQEIERVDGLVRERNELNQLVFLPASNPPILELQEPRKDRMKCQF